MEDFHLIDKLAKFDRERIPERVVHAKGSAAHGVFEVTDDITKYCKAKMFSEIGKKTPCFLRFSTVGGEKGSADTERDPRGYAIKFYTEEGNWDMVGNNTPVFFIRDPIKFPDFIHTQKRNPQTNVKDASMVFDFASLVPESNHQFTILFSDRGTPYGYRCMNGYGSHTFKMVNNDGEVFFVKFHFKTDQGIKNFTGPEADQMKAKDLEFSQRDLFTNIQNGNFPSWTFYVQVMPEKDAANYKFNILDITKVWPHADYPLIRVGKLTLNRNPDNYHAEVEQSAFAPAHMPPGIEASADKMLQGRLFSYPDTHRHRLGGNYDQIPINCPYRARVQNSQRDGVVFNTNQGANKNYEPNSFNYNTPSTNQKFMESSWTLRGLAQRYKPAHPNSDFEQAGALYSKVFNDTDRKHLIENLSGAMKGIPVSIQERQTRIFHKCHPQYGERLANAIGIPQFKHKL
jgi:catalase